MAHDVNGIKLNDEEYALIQSYRAKKYAKKYNLKDRIRLKKENKNKLREAFLTPCLNCGIADIRIICLHHINKTLYPNKVMCLCHNCHMLLHKIIGSRGITETETDALRILKG